MGYRARSEANGLSFLYLLRSVVCLILLFLIYYGIFLWHRHHHYMSPLMISLLITPSCHLGTQSVSFFFFFYEYRLLVEFSIYRAYEYGK